MPPVYPYICDQCGEFEETQGIKDDPLRECPKCKQNVRRLIGKTNFCFTGRPWNK